MAELSNPKVSVIIPVFNGDNFLDQAIESVLKQTYSNIELLVIDDGSTDGTWGIIRSYGNELRGFHKENGGVASALNLGISHATGKYIAWLSHDDIFLPQKIQCQVTFLESHPNYKACYTDFCIINTQDELLRNVKNPWYPRSKMVQTLFGEMYINGSTTLIDSNCFDVVGLFNENLAHTQDLDMWFRILEMFEIGHLDQILLKSRTHSQQGSWNFQIQISEEQIIYQGIFDRMGIQKILPSLKYLESNKAAAFGYEWFGDEMLYHRHWYKFAFTQYKKSVDLQPSYNNLARGKRIFAQVLLHIFGDEKVTGTQIKIARFLISQSKFAEARNFLVEAYINHPLRLDALGFLLVTWIKPNQIKPLQRIKNKLMGNSSKVIE